MSFGSDVPIPGGWLQFLLQCVTMWSVHARCTLSPRLTLSHLRISTEFSSSVNFFSDSSDIVLPQFPLSASSYSHDLLACSFWSLIASSQLFTLFFFPYDCYHSNNHLKISCKVYRIVLPIAVTQISTAFSKAQCENNAFTKAVCNTTNESLLSASEHAHWIFSWTQLPSIYSSHPATQHKFLSLCFQHQICDNCHS